MAQKYAASSDGSDECNSLKWVSIDIQLVLTGEFKLGIPLLFR